MPEKSDISDADALFHIAEPEVAPRRERTPGRGIGIDLGTTNSLVAVAPRGAQPRVLADGDGGFLLPSVVSYREERPVVGHAARRLQVENPERVISSVKRFMGRGPADIDFAHPYRLAASDSSIRFSMGEREVTPVEVSAEILRALKQRAEHHLGAPVSGAVITVPAYFDDAQRQATKDAGRVAGLQVDRLLAEPTAAALAYGLDRAQLGLFAVYDLGGGTFDISILRLREGVFQVLSTGGDSSLGGDDLDRALATHLLELAGGGSPTAEAWEEAQAEARRAKEALTADERVEVRLERSRLSPTVLDRATFEALVEPIVRRTVAPCRQALADADVSVEDLDGVVLVGGSTRVPLVRRIVERTFRQKPLADIDPDRVVAHGAAIQADILSGSEREGVTLLDVVPLSLGLETMGGIVEKIIPRNATIPISARQVFTNYSEQQTGMVFHVVQGEREMVAESKSLAKFELKGIPQLPPGMARIEVTFQLDADALLTVTAKELMTGATQSVAVKPTYGLSSDEVDRLVIESLDHAREDFVARDVAEARVELGRVVLAVQRSLTELGHLPDLLPTPERSAIETALASAQQAMANESAEKAALDGARIGLEHVSEPFARRRMERALAAGMQGKTLAEIEQGLAEEDVLERKRGAHHAEVVSND